MEMGRRRSAQNRDLQGTNLYPCRGGFEYVHPRTKERFYWPVEREKAITSAKKLNAILLETTDLVGDVLGETKTIAHAIKVFKDEDAKHRKWSKETREGYDFMVARIEKLIGDRRLRTFSTRDAAIWLKSTTDSTHSRIKYRNLLLWICACAVEEGWIEQNPVAATRRVQGAVRKRAPLTLEGFQAVYKRAGELGMAWLQRAMRIALRTLLRRGDVCWLQFPDARAGKLHVVPKKTKDSTSVHLRIDIDADLQADIDACRDDVLSLFMVHRLPGKAKPARGRAKERVHHTQVLPDQLSRAFKDVIDKTDMFSGVVNPPTFHEIRSLGGRLLMEQLMAQGFTNDEALAHVQALMGHASKEMTELYTERGEPRWMDVKSGLKLAGISGQYPEISGNPTK